MRPEIKEYNFDWMLWTIMDTGYKAALGTEKEFSRVLGYAPYFSGIIGSIANQGEPGVTFLKLAAKYYENIVKVHERGKKLALTTFCFSPAILYAMDAVPVTLEVLTAFAGLTWKRGAFDYLDYSVERGFTETACSSQRGSLGAYMAGLGSEIDFIVVDTAGICDTNANAFSFASAYLDKPFYQLNFPAGLTDERTKDYHRDDYKALITFLEEQTGNKLDEDKLREVLKELNRQDEMLGELEEMQRLVPSPLPGAFNLFIYAGRFMFAGWPEYTELLKSMVKVVRQNVEDGVTGIRSGREKCRALFFYIDHFTLNLRLWRWLDQHEISHIGGILSRFYSDNVPYTQGREEEAYRIETGNLDTMIDSIAEMNARMPMVRSIRGPYDAPYMWLDDALTLGKLYNADCMIYNGTPGCRNTWSNVKLIAKDLENNGYPTHIMYGDAFDDRVESWEATSERLGEFFQLRRLL